MFTGIIEEIGRLAGSREAGGNVVLTIEAPATAAQLKPGGSVSLNGICLTAISASNGRFQVEAVEETLGKTALREQIARGRFNLELPIKADGRFDGHIVLGHVDSTGTIASIEDRTGSRLFTIRHPADISAGIVHTGSVAVDGVSLTIASLDAESFGVSIIPATMDRTIFREYKKGERVNLETDIFGKYVERHLAARPGI